ncbi:hypothetical protein V7S43_002480 [Phytophthora oleae]|uniref:Uncharacterized protein n=1 Tax=Phytophthora oleae TaxID=2107226 RepID=A0ABD3G1Z7_9STRA
MHVCLNIVNSALLVLHNSGQVSKDLVDLGYALMDLVKVLLALLNERLVVRELVLELRELKDLPLVLSDEAPAILLPFLLPGGDPEYRRLRLRRNSLEVLGQFPLNQRVGCVCGYANQSLGNFFL